MTTSRIRVTVSGPMFDGRAQAAVTAFLDDFKRELADTGLAEVERRASRMNKSGRSGGTYRGMLSVSPAGRDLRIHDQGVIRGKASGPWLEGISQRNTTTGFKGYHQFKRTRAMMRRVMKPLAQERLDRYLAEMGGGQG